MGFGAAVLYESRPVTGNVARRRTRAAWLSADDLLVYSSAKCFSWYPLHENRHGTTALVHRIPFLRSTPQMIGYLSGRDPVSATPDVADTKNQPRELVCLGLVIIEVP